MAGAWYAQAYDFSAANDDGVTIYYDITCSAKPEVEVIEGPYLGDSYSGDVVIPSSVTYDGKTYRVTSIGAGVFQYCRSLSSITIPNSVTAIGNSAFSGCSSLEHFSAGYGVRTIGESAFNGCKKLTKYYSSSIVPPVCDDSALSGINEWECTLYVPAGSSDDYRVAPQWEAFSFVEEMEIVPVAEIKLNQTEATLAPNDTVRLTAQILPANATYTTLVWSSSDESIATVDETGLVTALAEGTATITAKSQDGNAEATCTITVEPGFSGIGTILGKDVEIEVYNLHGHQVGNSTDDLPAGVYIIKEGNKTYKTVVR